LGGDCYHSSYTVSRPRQIIIGEKTKIALVRAVVGIGAVVAFNWYLLAKTDLPWWVWGIFNTTILIGIWFGLKSAKENDNDDRRET